MQAEAASALAPWRRIAFWLGPALSIAISVTPIGLEPSEARAAAVAILMATWWVSEVVPLPVTALLPLLLFPLLGVRGSREISAAYADPAIFLFLGGFILALAVETQGLAGRAASAIATSPLGARPAWLLGAFCLATLSLSAWINNTATTMIMLPVALAISARAPEGLAKALLLAAAYYASIGGVATPIGTAPNILFAGTAARLGLEPKISFLAWMAAAAPIALAVGTAGWLILVRMFRLPWRVEGSSFDLAGEARRPARWTTGERRVAWIFAAAVLLWITRQDATIGSFVFRGWESCLGLTGSLSDAVPAIGIALACLCLGDGRGRVLVTWDEAERGVPWGIILLLGGSFALADGLQASGLAARLGGAVAGAGPLPLLVTVLLVTASMTFLSEVTSNTAQAGLVLPLMATAAEGLGRHPYLFMFPAVLACSLAFMMPAGTPPNAIVFATGRLKLREMARVGLLLNLASIAVVTLLAPLLLRALGLVGAGR